MHIIKINLFYNMLEYNNVLVFNNKFFFNNIQKFIIR